MSLRCIKPNFEIPKEYKRVFLLKIGSFRYCIFADAAGIHTGQMGECDPKHNSAVLDFIEESIMYVRDECGADK